jgi:hypothetical protein
LMTSEKEDCQEDLTEIYCLEFHVSIFCPL